MGTMFGKAAPAASSAPAVPAYQATLDRAKATMPTIVTPAIRDARLNDVMARRDAHRDEIMARRKTILGAAGPGDYSKESLGE